MMYHSMKLWPESFKAVIQGQKKWSSDWLIQKEKKFL